VEQPASDITPLIEHPRNACTECWSCARVCPVKAIRVINGRSEVVQEKCVACGLCVTECIHGGHLVRDDTPRVLDLLRSQTPVIALLASEFIAALHPMTVGQVERALEMLGFWAIETTLLGEEIVAEAYEQLHTRGDMLLSIRSTCPVAVDFVRKYYPALVPALAPIVPPYVAQARLIRGVYAADAAIVYVGPCYARKDEYRDPQFEGVVDAAIDFLELKRLMESVVANDARRPPGVVAPRPGVLKEISLTDGFPRQTLVSRDLTDADVHVIRGLEEFDRLLKALVAGETGPTIIDVLNCEGCIDGPAVNPGLSVFAKRTIESTARQHPGVTHVSTRAMLGVLPAVETVRSFAAEPVQVRRPTIDEVDGVLAAGRFTRETTLDCGACGWDTCVEHAIAIFNAESSWDLCLPLQRRLFGESRDALAESQTLDPITGLWNRRAFSDRLDVELARYVRYGSPLVVVFIDVDGFGAINDRVGRKGGDAVLEVIAQRLTGSLRTTDFPARWMGDQFAVILPGIGKTAGFAVAEKLRSIIGDRAYTVEAGGYTGDVTVTASLGIAAASPGLNDMQPLLEAADAALHEAMVAGGDRVHLAPG